LAPPPPGSPPILLFPVQPGLGFDRLTCNVDCEIFIPDAPYVDYFSPTRGQSLSLSLPPKSFLSHPMTPPPMCKTSLFSCGGWVAPFFFLRNFCFFFLSPSPSFVFDSFSFFFFPFPERQAGHFFAPPWFMGTLFFFSTKSSFPFPFPGCYPQPSYNFFMMAIWGRHGCFFCSLFSRCFLVCSGLPPLSSLGCCCRGRCFSCCHILLFPPPPPPLLSQAPRWPQHPPCVRVAPLGLPLFVLFSWLFVYRCHTPFFLLRKKVSTMTPLPCIVPTRQCQALLCGTGLVKAIFFLPPPKLVSRMKSPGYGGCWCC